ncbi:MAG: hypothetical protein JW753_05275 [Dehalococcoidia bacterium]|nr:hypothetical protein [Dehalococcoidia bacterium]
MYLLLTDETNTEPKPKAKFFAYGGLVVDLAVLPEMDRRIDGIRQNRGYRRGDALKFDTNTRSGHVHVEDATAAKNDVIEVCISLGCKFIVYVVLHEIAKHRTSAELIAWGANCVIGKFNYFLQVENSYGIVAVDRLPSGSEYSFLSDKFSFGLTFPDEDAVVLDRIKLFTSTCANASHASSAMDISLGAFRYCINQPLNVPAAKTMMANTCRMLWAERQGNTLYPSELGLVLRPKDVKLDKYKAEYKALIDHINSLLVDAKL